MRWFFFSCVAQIKIDQQTEVTDNNNDENKISLFFCCVWAIFPSSFSFFDHCLWQCQHKTVDTKACKICVKCLPRWITTWKKNYQQNKQMLCVCVCVSSFNRTHTRLELWTRKKVRPTNKQIAYLEQILFYFWSYVFTKCTHAAHKYLHGWRPLSVGNVFN